MAERDPALADSLVGLAWSLWSELGVSTWERSHQGWLVELEPLIVFTAAVGERDARLRREAVDWCAQHASFVSISQLRHVVKAWPSSSREGFDDFAATLSKVTGRTWPQSGSGQPYPFEPSGKSRLRPLTEPSLLQLRLRAMFGVGARAEILRCLLTAPTGEASVAQIAGSVAYTRRQVSSDLEMLARSGLLERRTGVGASRYALTDAQLVARVVGPLPGVAPSWTAVLVVLSTLATTFDAVADVPLKRPDVELAARLRSIEAPLEASRLRPPGPRSEGYDRAVRAWVEDLAARLAAGDATALNLQAVAPPLDG